MLASTDVRMAQVAAHDAIRPEIQCVGHGWWAHQDSNLEPRDYESPALTIEL